MGERTATTTKFALDSDTVADKYWCWANSEADFSRYQLHRQSSVSLSKALPKLIKLIGKLSELLYALFQMLVSLSNRACG